MKKNFALTMPPWKYVAAGGQYNVGTLAAKTWAGVPPRERDRSVLPVLHTRGFVNAASGFAPDSATPPVDGTLAHNPAWVEPPAYWGKQGTLLKTPRSLFIADLVGWGRLLNSIGDGANLDAAKIFRFQSAINQGLYNGLFLMGMPWKSLTVGDLGDGATGNLPVVDPATFTGGEVLAIISVGAAYYNNLNYDGVSVNPSTEETALLDSDLAAAKAALPRFSRLRFRLYASLGRPGEGAFYNTIVAAAVSAGLDASYTDSGMTLATIQADYHNFFGI